MAPATTNARIQFLCEKRQHTWVHALPSSLIGPASLANPAMPDMFALVMRPIVRMHARDALDACEAQCSAKDCPRSAATIVATPMSYLHNAADPFVIVMTVACCGSPECDRTLKREAAELMRGMAGTLPGQAMASYGVPPMARNAKCYCGSSHKYKKCCGKDDVAAE